MSTTRQGSSRLTGQESALGVLLERAVGGDDDALNALVSLLGSKYGAQIIRKLRGIRKVARTQTIEDVVQDSLIELVRRIREGELEDLPKGDQKAILAYFQRLCDHRLANAVRPRQDPLFEREKIQVPRTLIDESAGIPGDIPRTPARLRHRTILNRAIGQLSRDERFVINRYREGVPQAEIARIMGRSEQAVWLIIHKIKRRLLLDIAPVSPTAKRKLNRAQEERNRIPEREEVEKVVGALPRELREAVTLVHLEGGSEAELAAKLGERGQEKAKSRLKMAYRSLAGRMKLPFPETFEKLGR